MLGGGQARAPNLQAPGHLAGAHGQGHEHALAAGKQREELHNNLFHVLEITEGGNLNLSLGLIVFVISTGVTLGSLFHLELSTFQKCFTLLSVLFLVTQSFVVVETLRNYALTHQKSDHKDYERYYERFMLKGALFISGSFVYQCSVYTGFFIAVACSVYGLFIMPHTGNNDEHATRVLLIIASNFVLGSSLNLASVLRDRFDAEVWRGQFTKNPDMPMEMLEVCLRNSMAMAQVTLEAMKLMFLVLFITAFAESVFAFVTFNIRNGTAFVATGCLFLLVSTYYVAKAVEDDDGDPSNNRTAPSVGIFLLSVGLVVYGVMLMVVIPLMKFTLCFGIFFCVFSFFCLVKSHNRSIHFEHILVRVEAENEKRMWSSGAAMH